jgi:methylenetetrahydrofolate reductase (NADPH)
MFNPQSDRDAFDLNSANATKAQLMAFARLASTEISTHDEANLNSLAETLYPGTTVYVAHTPKASIDDVVRVAVRVQRLGLQASPHIVARRLESESALRAALAQLKGEGIERILLIAGDRDRPAGPFTSTLEVLESGATADAGIMSIGVAGHPEGHPAVSTEQLFHALRHKQDFADRTGAHLHVVTQFGFNSRALLAWAAGLRQLGIRLPVHAGIAGPTPVAKLIKFAVQCGVAASVGSMMKNAGAIAGLVRGVTSPEEMIAGVLRGYLHNRSLQIVQPHIYAFGGVLATATWFRAIIDGKFDLTAGRQAFRVTA